ncbi:hypothetical protein [Delftia lacustris]|uniref:hypothetical protein n=1 Tax=Delftia lacustris TaxID=558537 RepID=UPI0035A6052F
MTLHADDNAVSLLSMAMTTKLRKMRAKGRAGWDSESCTQQHLSNLLRAAVEKGDTVDVANYCAFLLARDESILPGEQPKPVASGGWMEQLGFEVRQHDEMLRIVVDDCGNEREATLTERVLWDALMAANAEFASAPQAPAAPSDGLEVLLNEALAEVKRIVDAEQVSLAPTFHNEVRRPNDKRKFHMGDALRAARNAAAALEKAFDVVIAGTVAAPAAPAVDALSQAVRDVLAERQRQVEAEGYDTEHDDAHVMGEIGALAALYLMPDGARDWDATSTTYGATLGQALLPEDWTMPKMGENRRRDVVKGIACGLAELERLDRAAAAHKEST